MTTLVLEAGPDTEDLAQFVLSNLDDQTVDDMEVDRRFAPSEGLASEPITISLALIGLATNSIPTVGHLISQWIEARRQQKAVGVIIQAAQSSPELAEMLVDLERKHSEVSVAFAENAPAAPKPETG
jgi:hypothetical protein